MGDREPEPVGSPRLEIQEHLEFQRKSWIAERIGWVFLWLVSAAGLAGVFGQGPLAQTEAGEAGGLRVQYERFLQTDASSELRIHLPPSDGAEQSLTVGWDYMREMEIQKATPLPLRMEAAAGSVRFVFAVASGEAARVGVRLRPQKPGRYRGFVESGGERVEVSQFCYP